MNPPNGQAPSALRVTIGMPVYNGAATVAAALDSLLAQSVTDFMLVISDNGSTDGTEAICRDYAARDGRIRYVRQPVNLGATMNFRHVLFAAATPYFMWAAGDDLWAPTFIETHLAALEADPRAVASQSRVLFTKAGRPSHMASGTYALTGSVQDNLARFLANPADNSRYYGLFRTAALQAVFPDRNFYALDWGVSAATLLHGTHLECDDVLMVRDTSDVLTYAASVRRDHRALLARVFPLLFMTQWLLRRPGFPRGGAILWRLLRLNLHMHVRFGIYKGASLADRHLDTGSPLRRAIAFVAEPGLRLRLARLGQRLRVRLGAMRHAIIAPPRRLARWAWRAAPLGHPQREAIKATLIRLLGARALRLAQGGAYIAGPPRTIQPIPPAPGGAGEDVWRLAPATPGPPALSVVLVVRGDIAATLRAIDALHAGEIPVQAIVADAGARDVTGLVLADLPGVTYLRLATDMPLGAAVQAGIGRASADRIAVIEAGTVPAPGFADAVLRGLRLAAAIAVQLRDRDGYVRSTGGRLGATPLPVTGAGRLAPSHPDAVVGGAVDFAHGGFAFRADIQPGLDATAVDIPQLSRALFGWAAQAGAAPRFWSGAVLYRSANAPPEPTLGTAPPVSPRDMVLEAGPIPLEPTALVIGAVEAEVAGVTGLAALGFRVLCVPTGLPPQPEVAARLNVAGVEMLAPPRCPTPEDALRHAGPEAALVVLYASAKDRLPAATVREAAPHARLLDEATDPASCAALGDGAGPARAALAGLGLGSFAMELQAVQDELRAAGPAYVPSAFWQWLSDANSQQIEHRALTRFKRTINNNYFQFLPGHMADPQMERLSAFCAAHPSPLPAEGAAAAETIGEPDTITTVFGHSPFHDPGYAQLYGTFVGMLWHFAASHDPAGLHQTLEEPDLGAPIAVHIRGQRVSQDLANSLHEWSRVQALIAASSAGARPRILEIGAGYGRLAHVFLHAGAVRYAIVDIAPALVVAKWYLCNVHPQLKVFGFRPFARYADVAAEIVAADICFFSANQLELLPEGFADVGVAVSCLHEMRLDQIQLYLTQLSAKARHAVYMKNWTRWQNPSDGIVVDRDTFRLPGAWRLMLDEAHPINDQMWETGYIR